MRLRNRWIFLLLFTFAASLVSSHAETEMVPLNTFFKNLKAGKPQVVLVYGTSLTEYGMWVQAMQDWFDAKYPHLVTMVNSGMHGCNSDAGVAHLQDKVLDKHPDLVFIEFGYNDAHTRFNLTPEHCADNLDKIVQGIHAQNPQAAIILQTMNVGWDNPTAFKAETERPQLSLYYDNYRNYAKAHSLPIIDNEPQWIKFKQTDLATFQKEVPDGNHPNKIASLAITWPGIKALLEQADAAAGGSASTPTP